MKHSASYQNKTKTTFDSDESYEELKKLISDAAMLDSDDQRRLKAINELPFGDEDRPDWNAFSIMAIRGLLYGYENGELSFEKMMKIAWNCTLPLKAANLAFHAMGALAAIATRITPREKNAKKPPFPTWVKKAAVEYALLVKRENSKLKLSPNKEGKVTDTVPSLTLKQLAFFDLDIGEGGNRLSEKTIYEWLNDYKYKNNLPLQNRGKKRQSKLKSNLS